MNIDNLSWLFAINGNVMEVNTEGVTTEESLIRPTSGGNCIAWTLGHLLRSRQFLLTYIGKEWAFPTDKIALYQRGSSGADFDQYIPLDELLKMWGETQGLLMEGIAALDEAKLTAEAPPLGDFARPDTLERRVLFLYFHETYHIGQLGLMRRLAGKEGAIK